MKWLAVFLSALIAGVWLLSDRLAPPVRHSDQQGLLPRVSSLKIVGTEQQGDSAETVLCVMVGWFDDESAARAAAAQALSEEWQVEEREQVLPPLHWVLIPPQPAEAARAQFQALYSDGVEAYIVTQGEYRNAISLGLSNPGWPPNRCLRKKGGKS